MSTPFWKLLKFAKTGISSPDMTSIDKMKALAMRGGEPKPVKMYIYVGTDEKTYQGTDDNVYASRKGA